MAADADLEHLEGLARLSKELRRLDAHSFWTIPAGSLSAAGDLIVAGSTGIFLLAAWPASGAFTIHRGRPMVGERVIPSLRALRSDAKHLGAKLSASSVPQAVVPIVCLTHGAVGMPRDVKGVHVVALSALVKDLVSRPRALEPMRVQRAARVLGVQIAGDQNRLFT